MVANQLTLKLGEYLGESKWIQCKWERETKKEVTVRVLKMSHFFL